MLNIYHYPHAGSQESIGRPDKFKKRRGSEKDRNSIYIDRSHSESAKDKSSYDRRPPKNHKRQRSWAGNKLLDVEGGVVIRDVGVVTRDVGVVLNHKRSEYKFLDWKEMGCG